MIRSRWFWVMNSRGRPCLPAGRRGGAPVGGVASSAFAFSPLTPRFAVPLATDRPYPRHGSAGGEFRALGPWSRVDRWIESTRTPAGRVVVLTAAAWGHILDEHPEMETYRAEILETVASPHIVLADSRPGRRRFHRSGTGPSRWLRVIVDFGQR